jgi:hypothetical protein
MINAWKSPWLWVFLLTGLLLCLFDGMFLFMGKGIATLAVSIMSTNFLGSCFTMGGRGERIVSFVVDRIILPFGFMVAVGASFFNIFADTAHPWLDSVLLDSLEAEFVLVLLVAFLFSIPVVKDSSG